MIDNLGNPIYVNDNFKWYKHEQLQKFIETDNAFNLPALKNLMCCVVINEVTNIQDFVIIDNKQNIIYTHNYPDGFDTVETHIKMIKIKKYFDKHEGIKSNF